MNSFYKKSSETFLISIGFGKNMANDETIVSNNVTAIDVDGNINTDVIDLADITTTAQDIYIRVRDGSEGENYTINVVVTTSADNVWEMDILMKIEQ